MDKKIFVVAIAIGTTLITTLLLIFMQGRDLSPSAKRLMWASLAAGVMALIAVAIVTLTR